MIPDAVGPDDDNGARFADLQAIGLGSLNPAFSNKPQLFQAALEIFPRGITYIALAALLLVRDGTDKDLPFNRITANFGERAFGFLNLFG